MKRIMRFLFIVVAFFGLTACKGGKSDKQYTITFNTNGGGIVESITVKEGTSVNKPDDPDKPDYDFNGWYYNNTKVTWPYKVTQNVAFDAKWDPKLVIEDKEYYVEFDSNDGSSVDKLIVKQGAKANKPTDPTRKDYTFAGWYLDDGTLASWPLTINNNIRLTAKWTASPLNIRLEGAKLKWQNDSNYDTRITIDDRSYITTSNEFNIPFEYQDGNNYKIMVEVDKYWLGVENSGYAFYQSKTESMMNKPVDVRVENNTLKWNWIGNEYHSNGFTMYIDGNDKVTFYSPQYSIVNLISDLYETKTYEFAIYANANDYYKDSEVVYFSYTYNVNEYDVTLKYNDGVTSDQKVRTTKGLINLPEPTKTGYQFNGWYRSYDGTNVSEQWSSSKKVMQNVTLYASWVEAINEGGREILSAPQASTTNSGFIWKEISRANGYEYRIKYGKDSVFSNWYSTNNTYINIFNNDYAVIEVKAKGDGNITGDSPVVTRIWNKANYSITSDVYIHYDIGVFYWDSLESSFVINLYTKDNVLVETQNSNNPEFIIPSNLSAGDYKLVVNGISRNVSYKMLATPEIINMVSTEDGVKVTWKNVIKSDSYLIVINNKFTHKVNAPATELIIPLSETYDNEMVKVTIKAECVTTDILNSYVVTRYFTDMISVNFNTNEGNEISSIYVPRTSVLKLDLIEIPEKAGYRFIGWYLDESRFIKYTTQTLDSNSTLYAKWEESETPFFNVEYDTNGGEEINPTNSLYLETVTLPKPVKAGFTFNGWYYDPYYEELVGDSIIVDGNITLYAKWIEGAWKFKEVTDGYEITSFSSSNMSVTIPNEYLMKNIVSIVENALTSSPSLKQIFIKDNIKIVKSNAFGVTPLEIYVQAASKPYNWVDSWAGANKQVYWNSERPINESDFTFIKNANQDTVRLNKYLGSDDRVVIPDYIEGYLVTSIEKGAFKNNSFIRFLDIPTTIESIALGAFEGCNTLIELKTPFIGESRNATSNKVYLGYIFGDINYQNSYTTGSYYLPLSLKKVTVTDQETIKTNAFVNARMLSHIVIEDTTTSIESNALFNTSSLESITLPFVGSSRGVTGKNGALGYIFSYYSFTGSYKAGSYYLPNTLSEVIVTDTTSINDYAFYQANSLTLIDLPIGLTSIGKYAFSNMENLGTINLPSTLKTISDYAFYESGGLFDIELPSGVTSIGGYAFSEVKNITNMILPSSLTTIGEQAFYGANGIETLVIPKNVTTIGERAFGSMMSLNIVEFESGSKLKTIESYIFAGSDNINILSIPSGVTTIKTYGLSFMSGLETLTLPSTIATINDFALHGTNHLKSLAIPYVGLNRMYGSGATRFGEIFGNKSYDNSYSADGYYLPNTLNEVIVTGAYNIAASAFKGVTSVTTLILPEGITTIGTETFSGMYNLKSIVIPSTVTSVASGAFYANNRLEEITLNRTYGSHIGYIFGNKYYDSGYLANGYYIPMSLKKVTITNTTQIAQSGFKDARLIETIILPDQVFEIGSQAFSGATNLREINLPTSLKNIYDYTFYNCSSLVDITISSNVKTIGADAFAGCSDLQTITVPSSVTNIGENAFAGCTSLVEMTLPFVGKSVDATGQNAVFGYLFGTTEYTGTKRTYQYVSQVGGENYYIPNSLKTVTITDATKISKGAFYNCNMLTTVNLGSTVTTIEDSAFYYCFNLTEFNLLNVTTIGKEVFDNCYNMIAIIIPEEVTTIGDNAFRNCSKLSIYVEVESKPDGWSNSWNVSNRPVTWGT